MFLKTLDISSCYYHVVCKRISEIRVFPSERERERKREREREREREEKSKSSGSSPKKSMRL